MEKLNYRALASDDSLDCLEKVPAFKQLKFIEDFYGVIFKNKAGTSGTLRKFGYRC